MDDITAGMPSQELENRGFASKLPSQETSKIANIDNGLQENIKGVINNLMLPVVGILPWAYFTPAAAAIGGTKIAGASSIEQMTSIVQAASLHHSTVVKALAPSALYGLVPVAAACEVQRITKQALKQDGFSKSFLPALAAGFTEASIGNFFDFATIKFHLASVLQLEAFKNNPNLLAKFSEDDLAKLMGKDYKKILSSCLSNQDLIDKSKKQNFKNIIFSVENIKLIQSRTGIGLASNTMFGAVAAMLIPATARNSMLYYAVEELNKESSGEESAAKFFTNLTFLSALSLPTNMITYGAAQQYAQNPEAGVLGATKTATKEALNSIAQEPRKTLALLGLRVTANLVSAFILSDDSRKKVSNFVDYLFKESARELIKEEVTEKQINEIDEMLKTKITIKEHDNQEHDNQTQERPTGNLEKPMAKQAMPANSKTK